METKNIHTSHYLVTPSEEGETIKIELGKQEHCRTFRYFGTITNKSTVNQTINDVINNAVCVDGIHGIFNVHVNEFIISTVNSLEFGELDKIIFEVENSKHVTIPFYMTYADDKTSLVILNFDKDFDENFNKNFDEIGASVNYLSLLDIYGLKSDGTITEMSIEPETTLRFDITYSYLD